MISSFHSLFQTRVVAFIAVSAIIVQILSAIKVVDRGAIEARRVAHEVDVFGESVGFSGVVVPSLHFWKHT